VSWLLCKSQLRCALRRFSAAAVAAPLAVCVGGAVAAALPALALWAGVRAADALEGAFALDPALAAASALCICLGAGLAGALLAAIVPGVEALGSQLAAAPAPPRAVVFGLVVLPCGIAGAVLLVPAVLFVAPLTGDATPSALASVAASLVLGSAAAEAAIALSRRALRGLALAGAVSAVVAFDPSRGLAEAVRGHPTAAPGLIALAAVAVWIAAAAMRPQARVKKATVRAVVRGPLTAALVRLARADELRRQAAIAVLAAGVGGVLLRAFGIPAPVAVLPAAATGILGAAVLPLAAAGLDRRADWLLGSVPRTRRSLALASVATGLVAGIVVAVGACAAAAVGTQAIPARAFALVPLACMLFAAAILAGAIVPWRASRAFEQLGSFGAFAVVAAALSFALARVAPVVHADSGVGSAVLGAATLVAGVLASAAIAGRAA
jgi:hypothetical protein